MNKLDLQNSSALKVTIFGFFSILSVLLLGRDLREFFHLVLHEEVYTHIAVIPFVSGFFIWSRRRMFLSEKGNTFAGVSLIACSSIYSIILNGFLHDDPVVALSLKTIGVILVIYGIFLYCWGFSAFKKLLFPFSFLLLAIPLPQQIINSIVTFLQWGSAVTVDAIFTMLGQSFVHDGTSFHLDTLSITIAPECSGIRSTMALIITGAAAVEMFLKTGWKKIIMLLLIIPLSLLKNAIRIVTITMLAQYVDMSFLTDSFLHHSGGIFFYLIVLAIYFPLIFLLAKQEIKQEINDKIHVKF